MKKAPEDDVAVLARIIAALKPYEADHRQRLLQTVETYFSTDGEASLPIKPESTSSSQGSSAVQRRNFSGRPVMSPKEFLHEKQPRTDVERVACLGYYLTHYRSQPHFNSVDLSKLNTEAAQIKFANASVTLGNAVAQGYLAAATKGSKQLSAAGEAFVQLLPDREAARGVMVRARGRRGRKPKRTKPARKKGVKH